MVTALEKGMKIYIPLTVLTKKACHDARTAAVDKESRHVVKVEEGSLQVHVSKFDSTGEESISIEDWRDASSRYVTLLHDHLWGGDRKAHGWAKAWQWHFDEINRRIGSAVDFAVLREYDIRLRREWVLRKMEFRPDMWHGNLYDETFRNHVLHQMTTLVASSTSNSSSSSTSNSSFRRPAITGGKYSKNSQSESTENMGNTRCMYCGKRSHKFTLCRSGTHLHRDAKGIWRDSEGKTYCHTFNGPSTCPRRETCKHIHACSLCLGRDHGAQQCAI